MAVGAGSPELKLSVGFDLAYFRNQLPTLGAAASSYALPINIKFNRLGLQEEFNKLGRNISGRQYNLKVEIKSLGVANEQARSLKENLEALTKIKFAIDTSAIGDAKDALKALKGEAAVAVKNARAAVSNAGIAGEPVTKRRTVRQGLASLSTEDLGAQYKKAAETGIIAYNEAITKNRTKMVREIGKVADAVSAGFVSKGSTKFSEKAKADAEAYIKGLEKDLEIASPSKRTQRIGEQTDAGWWIGLSKNAVKWERKKAAELRGQADRLFSGFGDYLKNKTIDLTVTAQVELEVKAGALAKFGGDLAKSASQSVGGALVKALRDGTQSAIGAAIATPFEGTSIAAGGGAFVTGLLGGLAKGGGSPIAGLLQGNVGFMDAVSQIAHAATSEGAQAAVVTVLGIAAVKGAEAFADAATASMAEQALEQVARFGIQQVAVRVLDGGKALFKKGATDIAGLRDGSTLALLRETSENLLLSAGESAARGSKALAKATLRGGVEGLAIGGKAAGVGLVVGGQMAGAGIKAGWENSLEQRIAIVGQLLGKVNQALNFLEDVAIKGAVDIQGLTDGRTIAATKQALLGYKATLEIGAAQLRDFHAALKPGNIERVAVREMLSPQAERVGGQRLLPPIGQSSAGIRQQYRRPNIVPEGGFPSKGPLQIGGFPGDGPISINPIKSAFRKIIASISKKLEGESLDIDRYDHLFRLGGFPIDQMLQVGGAPAISQGSGGFMSGHATRVGGWGGYNPGVRSSAFFPMNGMMGPSSPIGGGGGGGNPPRGPGGGGGGGNPPSGPIGGGSFPSDGMHIPSTQLGAGYHTVNKGISAIGNAYGGVKSFLNTSRLPLSGAITDLGSEFGNAVKQVLLFGTAYKAIAFLQNVPGEAFNAAKGLATYKNQLQAITAESGTFEQSFVFVEGLAQRFNVPLESARQGFVRLYASMRPAGFDQGQIESLFTGISKSAAAFGLSSDQVDRVTNAFSQMASKGQIMAEEVKGQLGDVLPGALSLFAKAAQMSLPEFTKAMEDGRFKGAAMAAVLDNVGVLLSNKFGPAAQGAAKTLQGAVNQINNNLKLMYESLTPIANNIAAAFGPGINSLIADVTSTVKALTSTFTAAGEGFNTLTPRAQSFYLAVKEIEPSLRQAGAAIADLAGRFQTFLPTIVSAISLAISFAASPLGRAAIIAAVGVGTLTAAFKLLAVTGLEAALRSVYRFIGSLLGIPAATGAARLAIIGLKLAITGVFVGAILIGLDFLVGKLLDIGGAAEKSRRDVAGLKLTLDGIAETGDVKGAAQAYMDANTKVAMARAKYQKAAEKYQTFAPDQAENIKFSGTAQNTTVTSPSGSKPTLAPGLQYVAKVRKDARDAAYKELQAAEQNLRDTRKTRNNAVKIAQDRDKQTQAALKPIPPSEGESTKKKTTNLESYESLKDTLAKNFTQAELDRQDALYQDKINRINAEFDLREARANSFQKEAIKFERQMSDIDLRRQKALLDASKEVLKSQGSVAGGTGGFTGLLQGNTGISGGAHFDVRRQDGSYLSQSQARALFDSSVAKQLTMTSPYGPRTAPVPGASTYHRGVDLAGPANTPLRLAAGYTMTGAGEKGGLGYAASVRGPQGEMYDVGHLQRPAAGARAPGKVLASEKRDEVAIQKTQLALAQQSLAVQIANAQAVREAAIAWAEYTASIAPVEEQKLQNSLLEKKGQLIKSGLPDDVIEKQMKQFETEEKTKLAIEGVNKRLADKKINADQAKEKVAELTANMIAYNSSLNDNLVLQRQQQFDASITSLNRQIQLGGIIDPQAEQRQKYIQEGLTPGQADEKVKLEEQLTAVTRLRDGYRSLADSIGNSFGQAFKGVVSGSMTAQQALAGFFQSVADSFLDMVAQMVAAWMRTMVIKGFQAIIGALIPGFGGGGGGGGLESFNMADVNTYSAPLGYANGGIATGGFRAFASGGIVTGPTLGLVGEGRYNEAVIPLPDGKSVPVDLGGAGMGGNQITSNIVVNVSSDGQSQSQQSGNDGAKFGKVLEATVKQVIINELRPGGTLSSRR
jgi:tape measure domain-containing protein